MLYQLHEMAHAAVYPWRLLAQGAQEILAHPGNPFAESLGGRTAAAGLALFEKTTRRYGKPAFGLDQTVISGKTVAVREEVVHATPFARLLHFRRDAARDDPRLLVAAPLSGHYATLLRDTVRALLPDHDIYITDWTNARMIPLSEGRFDLDDYIEHVIGLLRFLGEGSHVMAVCQPSVPVLAAVSLMAEAREAEAPKSMILMGGPIDTRLNPTAVNELATKRSLDWFERSVITRVPVLYPGFLRRVYPGFLQLTGFMSMNLDLHVAAHVRYYHHLIEGDGDSAAAHQAFYDEYLSVMDLPAEYYLQTVKTVFQDHDLALGRMTSRGRRIDPRAITKTALMTIEGERDDITGAEQTRAAHALCPNIPDAARADYEQPGVGHYGIFNGRRWRTMIAPRVRDFIRTHD